MAGALTNPRVAKDFVAAWNHQTDFTTAAATGTAQRIQVLSCEIDAGYEYVHPRGSTGSYRPKDTHKKVAERPKATLEILASPKVLPFLWEYALGGQPQASSAASDITEANDGGNVVGTWVFNGIRPGFNTDSSFKLYVTVTDETPGAGQATVSVYKDSARTQKVAEGSGANSTTATLAEQNSSGLSGTVALAAPAATDSDIELTIVSVRPQESGTLARYFTMWRDHGSGRALEKVHDCAVTKMTRESEQSGVVKYKLDIVGSTYTSSAAGGGVFDSALVAADKEYMTHAKFTMNSDVDSGNVAQHVIKADLVVENDIEVLLANAATASLIWKRGVKMYELTVTQRLSDEAQTIAERGVNDTFESVGISDAYASRISTFVLDKAKRVEPAYPDFGDEGFEDIEHKFMGFEETPAPVV